jgi:cilia- and flagella-associated protein 57
VWNFVEHKQLLCKHFTKKSFSVALHPSGQHLIVGVSDKLRLMNLLMDDMRTYR